MMNEEKKRKEKGAAIFAFIHRARPEPVLTAKGAVRTTHAHERGWRIS